MLKSLTFRTKLTAAIVAVSTMAIACACWAFIQFEISTFKRELIAENITLAEVVSNNIAAAVLFEDNLTLDENMGVFEKVKAVQSAQVTAATGSIVSFYQGEQKRLPPARFIDEKETQYSVEEGALYIRAPIIAAPDTIGTLHLIVSMEQIQQKFFTYLSISAMVMMAALAITLLLAHVIAQIMMKPVATLMQAMERVEETQDYSHHVAAATHDEFGKLTGSFNAMMDKVQRRDEEMETAVRNRTEELEIERDKAEAASKAKSEFLANMSHEIRTPMNGVLGLAEILLQTSLDKNQKKLTSTILSSGTSLIHIINDILDFSRIEAGKIELVSENVCVRTILEETVSMVKASAIEKGLDLQLMIDPALEMQLVGDGGRLRQVITNLVGNAIKFTDDGHVIVRASVKQKEDAATVIVSVEDTGIGIDADKLDHMFEKFTQADYSSTRRHEGTGLGLAISKSIVELMDGSIGAKSEVGTGSTFWLKVVLPVAENVTDRSSPAETVQPEAAPVSNVSPITPTTVIAKVPGKYTVLVAEDNIVNQMVIQNILDKNKYDIHLAENGAVAVEMFQALKPDVIVMDISMPMMNGLQATQEIRKMEAQHGLPPVPIIAATAHARDQDREECFEAGMNDFIAKPIKRDPINAIVEKWVEQDCEKQCTA
jgi:signal transduction histidine kinase/ActR/RegA family two-component response regulator